MSNLIDIETFGRASSPGMEICFAICAEVANVHIRYSQKFGCVPDQVDVTLPMATELRKFVGEIADTADNRNGLNAAITATNSPVGKSALRHMAAYLKGEPTGRPMGESLGGYDAKWADWRPGIVDLLVRRREVNGLERLAAL